MTQLKKYLDVILTFINDNQKLLQNILLSLSISWFLVFLFPRALFSNFWSLAWKLLIVVMLVRPLRDIFPKCKLFSTIILFRRQLAILVWIFAIAHVFGYAIDYMNHLWDNVSYMAVVSDPENFNVFGFLFWGILAFLVSIPLLLSSNDFLLNILWKYRKKLQRLSYFMFVFTWLHIVLIKWELWPLFVIIVYAVLFYIAYIKNKKKIQESLNIKNATKRLCVPCGYVYDEKIWDPDSGILPGTKFEDIPENWRCPVCWVTKKDFIPIKNDADVKVEVVDIKTIADGVFQLIISFSEIPKYKNWQYFKFKLQDEDWEFERAYSLADVSWNEFTFLIKPTKDWRSINVRKNTKKMVFLKVNWPYWDFELKNTTNPKVFIATGTWIAPIYNLVKNMSNNRKDNKLFFGVREKKDFFYEKELSVLSGVEKYYYLSKEKIEWFNYGRIDLSKFTFDPNTEFYICWNPNMIQDISVYLKENGFDKVYFEKFLTEEK